MLVNMYALKINGRQTWHFAIDIRAAALFWLERHSGNLEMVILEPDISLGQAMLLLGKLAENTSSRDSGQERKAHEIRVLNTFYQGRNKSMRQYNRNELENHVQGLWYPNAHTYTSIVKGLSGRQLLFEEVQALVEHVMMEEGNEGQAITLTKNELKAYIQYADLRGDICLLNGLEMITRRQLPMWWRKQHEYVCRRCGSGMNHMHITHCSLCNASCAYCEACLTMGRVRHCSLLVKGIGDVQGVGQVEGVRLQSETLEQWIQPWGLSPAQAEAARSGLQWLETQINRSWDKDKGTDTGKDRSNGGSKDRSNDGSNDGSKDRSNDRSNDKSKDGSKDNGAAASQFLIWAVTGAGKTEMIFPFIGHTLARGGKVLIATPRRDVVLELRPRVMRAFPGYAAVVLYGGSEQRWDSGPIVIATTHQLLRYHEAFDLVIIDELDAFPYHGDPMLEFAARRACKPSGSTLLLSATPPSQMRRDTVRGKLPHVKVPARYHGYPLPVPRQLAVPALPQMRKADALPSALLAALRASLARGAQLFVFVPSIATIEPLVHLLRRTLLAAVPTAGCSMPSTAGSAPLVIEGTSSKDSDRTDKVQQFRDGHIRILVTTTILERGVTVPKTDVFVLDANSRLFDEASLVQMSGRAGRSKDDPEGRVYFAAAERTKAQSGAITQIRSMNRLAKQKGYLHGRSNEL